MKGKTVLVTGGAGAIGSYLVARLVANNRVTVFDDLSSGSISLLPRSANLTLCRRSILEEEALKEVFTQRFDCVFHLAAQFANQNSIDYPRRDLLVNGLGTLKLLQYAVEANVGRFIFASSSCVLERHNQAMQGPSVKSTDTPYAITKLLGEHYVSYFHDRYGLQTVILRYFNSFGPGDYPGKYRSVIPNFLYQALMKKPLLITGTGNETRDFNYCQDTVEGTLRAAECEDANGRSFQIGSGVETTIKTLAEKINTITGNDMGIQFAERREWDRTDRRVADIADARRILDYKPSVSLDEGLKQTYDWLVGELKSVHSRSDRIFFEDRQVAENFGDG